MARLDKRHDGDRGWNPAAGPTTALIVLGTMIACLLGGILLVVAALLWHEMTSLF
jgi:hypothetical protein